jgi:hypothetical protein
VSAKNRMRRNEHLSVCYALISDGAAFSGSKMVVKYRTKL